MRKFDSDFTQIDTFINNNRKPDFNQLLKVLKGEIPDRPTLFEFYLNMELQEGLTKNIAYDTSDPLFDMKQRLDCFRIAGYDYVTMTGSDFNFPSNLHQEKGQASVSMNSGAIIFDRESFNNYKWPDPTAFDYSRLDILSDYLPEGQKILISGADGVLENVTKLVGYENLCYMLVDEPDLVFDIFEAVGSRFVKYYKICSKYDSVGALISNDDWGFCSQTMMSTEDMKKYVVPWHKKIVEVIHASGKPALLHSCGKLDLVMDIIIDNIRYDAKHSYEDKIRPVEEAYEKYGSRIATLGGLDLDFVCRSTPEEVYNRASAILKQTSARGGYALGSGNTIPYYVPKENYFAMIAAAVLQ